jgi:hypothetical protein
VYVIGDPSGRSKNSSYEETSFDLLKNAGLKAYPAPTNAIDKRLKAVENLLLQQRDGAGALLIDADWCPKLVMALSGRYRFAKRKNNQLSPMPEKLHPWSDLADDLQYFCVVITGGAHEYFGSRFNQTRVTADSRNVRACRHELGRDPVAVAPMRVEADEIIPADVAAPRHEMYESAAMF